MHTLEVFLRPLSEFHTGTLAHVEEKAEKVQSIVVRSGSIRFHKQNPVSLKTHRGIEKKEISHPERHWWVITGGLFERIQPPLREHGDIADFVTSLNLCVDDPVGFSQSPGRVVGGAYKLNDGILNYRNLSTGSLGLTSAFTDEIPELVEIRRDIEPVFRMVRELRANEVSSDEEMDLRVALHMYDDALTTTRWTTIANLYYVCENVLCSGRHTDPVGRIEEVTNIDNVDGWREMVNRIKHPDKGEDTKSLMELIEHDDWTVPFLEDMRRAANTALLESMQTKFESYE